MAKEIKLTPQRLKFIEKYQEFNDSDTLKEILYAQQIQINKLESIRSNTSKLVWWLIALPIIFGIFFTMLGLRGFMM